MSWADYWWEDMCETVYGVVGYALVNRHRIERQLIATDQQALDALTDVCRYFSLVTVESDHEVNVIALVGSNAQPRQGDVSTSLFRSISEFSEIRNCMTRACRLQLTPLRAVPRLDRETIETIISYVLAPPLGSELVN